MKRHAPTVLVLVLVLLVAASSAGAATLTNPDGTPVGGTWQQWVDQMKIPTISGNITFTASGCTYTSGVTASGCSTPQQISVAAGPLDRYSLYFELGHEFDEAYLTSADRAYLARKWGVGRWHWPDSAASIAAGGEDGLEGVFPIIYTDCAKGLNDNNASIVAWNPPGITNPPQVNPTINTCVYLDQIAERHGADMEATATARWNQHRVSPQRHSR